MSDAPQLNIHRTLEDVGEAVLVSLAYRRYPLEKLDALTRSLDEIMSHPANRRECEQHLRSSGSNYVLFFISNILYNLKQRGQLVLTEEVMKWLTSVWKNFLKRNRSYQEMFPLFDEYRITFKKYYPGSALFINQIENVNLIKDDFIGDPDAEDSPVMKLEKFHQGAAEVQNAMKPSYFFLLDYYYEKKMATGADSSEAVALEAGGIARFGQTGYTYADVTMLTCQALGILEAAYLILKKKKSQRRLINVDGRQKFLGSAEIYTMYLDKFNAMKKELSALNK